MTGSPRPRAALITGGGGGLGRAIAGALVAEGWSVGLLGRSNERLQAAVAEVEEQGPSVRAFPADVLAPEALAVAVARFVDWAGGLDALILAAGRLRGIGPLVATDPAESWRDLETALRGGPNAITAAWPHLKASAAGSITALVGPGHNGELAHAALYAAAQAGLVRLVETLDRELAPLGVPVFAVNPGVVPTPLMLHILDGLDGRRWLPRFTEAFAEGKEVGPEVVAEMVAWLVDRRPPELSGRVVPALGTPAILETRLDRIAAEDLNRLRLR